MWREAVSELRLHPSRFVATLLAIAISVGFIAAISVFINSQQNAMGKQASLPISTSDVVISLAEGGGAQAAELAALAGAAAAVEGRSACDAAARAAERNDARVAECVVEAAGRSVVVEVTVATELSPAPPGGPLTVSRRATAGT